MTETEVQALFKKFGAPLAPEAQSAERRSGAVVIVKALWAALIAGPVMEEETWKMLNEVGHLPEEELQAIKDCYYQKMKPLVSDEQLAALRERYDVKQVAQ
jgi:hypothetical protein